MDLKMLDQRVKIMEQAKPTGASDEKRFMDLQEEINAKTVNKSEFMEALKIMQALASKSESVNQA